MSEALVPFRRAVSRAVKKKGSEVTCAMTSLEDSTSAALAALAALPFLQLPHQLVNLIWTLHV